MTEQLSTSETRNSLRGKVAALWTRPETVIDDMGRLMELAGYTQTLPAGVDTLLKINISWHHYYPACSTTPWQFDGVTQAMLKAGWRPEQLIPAQNATVVVDPKLGSVRTHLVSVADRHGLEFVWLYEPEVEWITYEPQGELLCLPEIFPDGIDKLSPLVHPRAVWPHILNNLLSNRTRMRVAFAYV